MADIVITGYLKTTQITPNFSVISGELELESHLRNGKDRSTKPTVSNKGSRLIDGNQSNSKDRGK